MISSNHMYNANQEEQKILDFWEKDKTFEKSISSRPEDKKYVFYDGPPFATGLPHYGHILSSVIKDVVPRYWTMKGCRVNRRWGWDCHGLPVENLVEKELKISGKKDIEKFGIDKFNEACRSKVLLYTHEWKKMITRIGRWVEFDNAYKTMDSTYMESVWWALKSVWDKGLVYEGRKVLMYCPRCETPISKAEVAMDNSYKEVTEEAVTIKFKVKNPEKSALPENTYLLAWTTTPWTLPGNVALAVGGEIEYLLVKNETRATLSGGAEGKYASILPGHYVFAKARLNQFMGTLLSTSPEEMQAYAADGDIKKHFPNVVKTLKGTELAGLEYEPLFDVPAVKATGKRAFYVATADFVKTDEGTGIVHTAVMYGEEDYALGIKLDLPVVPLLDEKGFFNDKAPETARGQYFKKAEREIKADLDRRGLLFSTEQHTHAYPHCWRCETQLYYNAISAWFIDIQKNKARLLELNEKINWYPDHLKHGRFQNILETAPDWNISRNRYWATPLPFWRCQRCKRTVCIGSVRELKEKAVNFEEVFADKEKVTDLDLHKHVIDKIRLRCEMCKGEMLRIPEVIDCWVESGSMPFAELHYPFQNRHEFDSQFPGQYIAEYIAQTRAWFYYMHAMSTLLFDNISFENCVTTGTILNEKGEKLSKSKMNFTDPWIIIEQYGVDALRYYLMTSVVMEADNLLFNNREVRDVYNKVINILWNVVVFYKMFASADAPTTDSAASGHILDRWIMARLNTLVAEVTTEMDGYNTVKAGRPIKDFIDDLSTWYLRRSRDRFKGEDEADKQAALATLRDVLLTLSKLMAPFTPFIAEKIYQTVSHKTDSVHLQDWPKAGAVDKDVLVEMAKIRRFVELGLAVRAESGIRVRQVLGEFFVNDSLSAAATQILADELNVVKIITESPVGAAWIAKEEGALKVALNTAITPELKKEGLAREIIRTINQVRKNMELTIADKVSVEYATSDDLLKEVFEKFESEIAKGVLASEMKSGAATGTEVVIDERPATVNVVKV